MSWVLPILLMATFVAGQALLYASNSGTLGMLFLAARVIFFDYLVFFFGWLAGWNIASRWRRDPTLIEELSITNLRPSVVGSILFAGSLNVWWRLLLLASFIDLALLALFVIAGVYTPPVGLTMEQRAVWAATALATLVPFFLLLAWFHLESLRIAFWMFASAALPRLNLRNRALFNLIAIPFYVTTLTFAGMAVTGAPGLILAAFFMAGMQASIGGNPAFNPFQVTSVWAVTAVMAMLLVGLAKRALARAYEDDFWKNYLLYGWWGAGETQHPVSYPVHMRRLVVPWRQYLRAEERTVAKG